MIAASFSKFKNVSREKHGIRKEKYLKVESQPAVRANREDYSGTYEIPDLGFAMHLRVDHSGRVEGDGYEPLNEAESNGPRRVAKLIGDRVLR